MQIHFKNKNKLSAKEIKQVLEIGLALFNVKEKKMFRRKQQQDKNFIRCDVCKNQWNFNETQIKKEDIKLNDFYYTITYFICNKCKKVYIISITDSELESLIIDLKKTRKKINNAFGTKNLFVAEYLRGQLQNIDRRIKNKSKELKENILNEISLEYDEEENKLNILQIKL